jgi:hypothetical protein
MVAIIAIATMCYAMEPLEDGEIPERVLYVGNPADKLPRGITLNDVASLEFHVKQKQIWLGNPIDSLTKIIDKGEGSLNDRLDSFNYLRNWIHLNRLNVRTQETVTKAMLFAQLVLWDELGGSNQLPRTNDILTKLLDWEGSYLSEIDSFISEALNIHSKLFTGESREGKRITATLIGHQGRLKQLSLLMNKKNGSYEDVDPDQSRRREIYNYYKNAWDIGKSKSYLFQMIRLVLGDNYSPTGAPGTDAQHWVEFLSSNR